MPFLIALVIAAALTPLAGRLGLAIGLVDRPGGELKIHTRVIPILGGLAIVAATLVSMAITGGVGAAVVGAIGLMLVIGLIDDMRPLAPWIRVFAQAAAGAVLVAGGVRVEPLGVLGGVATVVVVLACSNAVNLIDGQDGLAAGLVAIAALGLVMLAAGGNPARLGLALAGALVGFLFWNRPPARIFLGNGGAYAAGVTLAAVTAMASHGRGWAWLLGSSLCLGAFAFELVFTVIRRVGTRAALTGGDRLHTYDLLAVRVGRLRSTVTFWTVGAAVAGLALFAATLPVVGGTALALGVCGTGTALGLYLWSLRRQAGARTAARSEWSE